MTYLLVIPAPAKVKTVNSADTTLAEAVASMISALLRGSGTGRCRREFLWRGQLLPLLMAHKARCLKDEPGTLQFEILVPHDKHAKILS
jgi:hypothetical protein